MFESHEVPIRWAVTGIFAASVLPFLINIDSFLLMDDLTMVGWGLREDYRWFFEDPLLKSLHFFRPGLVALCRLDGMIWGSKALGYRLTNLFLFAGSCFLVWGVARKFLRSSPAFLAALIFAIHPIQTPTVVWISGRVDLLPGVFVFCAALLHLGEDKLSRRIMAIAAFILALLCKETAVMLPVALLLGDRHLGIPGRRAIGRALPFIAIALIYVVFHLWTGIPSGSNYYNPIHKLSSLPGMIRNILSLATNTSYLFLPFWNPMDIMSLDYPESPSLAGLLFNRVTLWVIVYLAIGWAFVLLIFLGGFKPIKDNDLSSRYSGGSLLWFGVGWFLFFLLPTAHVLANMAGYRYFFISLLGGVIVLVWAGESILSRYSARIRIIVVALFLLICLAMNVIEQLKWKAAFDTSERFTLAIVRYTEELTPGTILKVYGLPQFTPGMRLVYPRWNRYSLPRSVRLTGGKKSVRVRVIKEWRPECNKKNIHCLDAGTLLLLPPK